MKINLFAIPILLIFLFCIVASVSAETINVYVTSSYDDAEQGPGGGISLTSSDLELVYDGGNQEIGMRFTGIDIPKGANIVNAYVEFTVDQKSSEQTSLNIYGQDSDNAEIFSKKTNDISSRPKTSSYVQWNNIEAWNTVAEKKQTPDISSVIREITERPGWSSGNDMAIIINGNGERVAESYNGATGHGDPLRAPLLMVEYQTGPIDDEPPSKPENLVAIKIDSQVNLNWNESYDNVGVIGYNIYRNGVVIATPSHPPFTDALISSGIIMDYVTSSSDDAEQGPGGGVSLTSSDLELVYDGADQEIGMRFTGIGIPKGANIVNAYVEFTVDQTSSGQTSLNIYGQDSDDAATFSKTTNDISSRPKTSSFVQWNYIEAWNTVAEKKQTPDISSVIREITERPGWSSGNDMAIIINGNGERVAESYNGATGHGDPSRAPLLVVEYEIPSDVNTYTVSAFDAAGNEGLQSDPVIVEDEVINDTQAPSTPQDLVALAVTSYMIQLDWTDSTDDIGVAGYEIHRNGMLIGTSDDSAYVDNDVSPNSMYVYAVSAYDYSGNHSGLSDALAVTTPNVTGWKFTAYGDTRSGHDEHTQNVLGIVNKIPNNERITVLNSGDVTYDGSEANWQIWSGIVDPLDIDQNIRNPPEYIGALGNHDDDSSGWETRWLNYLPAQNNLSAYPEIAASQEGLYGSAKYDNVIFIWLDSVSDTAAEDIFIESTLQRAASDPEIVWKFVVFHHPPIPCGRKSDWEKGKEWHDSYFVPYGVDVVFLGHAHYYERTCPFTSASQKTCDEANRGDLIGDSEGVVHIITGGGGASVSPPEDCIWLDKAAGIHHFLEIMVDGNQLNIKAWDTTNGGNNSVLFDDFTITKGLCGDSTCNPGECDSCISDCPLASDCCGDMTCQDFEDCVSCPNDCGSCCGNGICDLGEDYSSCSQDCYHPADTGQDGCINYTESISFLMNWKNDQGATLDDVLSMFCGYSYMCC